MRYIIGIDTGGTCTDAVLMETETGTIVATSKQPTTHSNLAEGTAHALSALLESSKVAVDTIDKVAVSSTLATNSVVENKGARVALLVIGYVKHFKLPVKAIVFIKGGHNFQGVEEEELDLDYLVNIVDGLRGEVDAYGVCSAMSIKNPAHELVAEKAISMLDPKPVFCSHQVSSIAGMQQRAATAGLHATLMPIMDKYVNGVQDAMQQKQLNCPMVVVAGNCDLVESAHIVHHAGLTVASGPACTAHFGALQSREQSLVIDVGGTTTDIAMIENGAPLMSKDGCQVGAWRTHIEAVDMHTGGIGGDSHVRVDKDGQLHIGPIRVEPISMCSMVPATTDWLGLEDASKIVFPCNGENQPGELLQFLFDHGPATPEQIAQATKYTGVTLQGQLKKLEQKQHIFECGFTPTDALHVLGKINIGDTKRAVEAATILGSLLDISAEEFSQRVLSQTQELIENMTLDYIVQHYWGKSLTNFISSRNSHPVLGVNFSLKIPLIGIGAAAREILPGVAKKLGTTVVFPDYCEVGNAVGAAHLARGAAV